MRASDAHVKAVAQPLLLALDTSTSNASVALFDGQRVLSETTWLAGREHSSRLLVEVDTALERVGKTVADLSGLVVARGPGSFTGVRVAISVAKGMAAGLSIPVWGVSSLDVLAHAAGEVDVQVRAALEAGRGRYATALYLRTTCVQPPRLATVEQLAGLLDVPTVVIGELSLEHRAQLELHPLARLASPAASLRRAGFVAQLGWQLARSGDPGEATRLDALYIT